MEGIYTSRQFIAEFLELYRAQECLWNMKRKDYYDKEMRQRAYDVLIEKLKETDPAADRSAVIRKIDSLRGCFRKEQRKVMRARMAGGPPYVPRLWYYDFLVFLSDGLSTKRLKLGTNDNSLNNEDYSLEENSTSMDGSAMDATTTSLRIKQSPGSHHEDDYDIPTVVQGMSPMKHSPRSAQEEECSLPSAEHISPMAFHPGPSALDDPLRIPDRVRIGREDEFDIMARNIGNKLRKLPQDKVFIVEKLITDLIFEAQMGTVNQYTRLALRDIRDRSKTT